jgi:valyl-tRNA synthetase
MSASNSPDHAPAAPRHSHPPAHPPASAPGPALDKAYKPADHEARIRARWEHDRLGHANPAHVNTQGKKPFSIFIPPPNVTGALHLGHALNNTLQDTLTRFHRMRGYEALWMPGTDHAGIATQAVVEKRLQKEHNKRRTDYTREQFVAQVQAWKDEYEALITEQLKAMGCSCDWDRRRFTMDPVCARAVREAFFRLFKDGLIYRGKRLVNWDPALQTAVADDECYDEEIDTSFWYLRYPLTRPVTLPSGETIDHVTVATTRPETYLGDTAVAINPHDPRAGALVGQNVTLPFVGRTIPIVADSYVVLPKALAEQLGRHEDAKDPKAEYATGFLKVTPAHDQNDYELGQRHADEIRQNSARQWMINMMSPDGRVSDQHGWIDTGDAKKFVGLKMAEARKAVVKAFEEAHLLEKTRPYRQTVTKSDRSKAQIEPYLSDQWYVRVTDQRLAPAANAALHAGQVRFTPERYAKTFEQWHTNIRDWCISRQLWWGHRIPVWYGTIQFPRSIGPKPVLTKDWLDASHPTIQAIAKLIEQRLPAFFAAIGRPGQLSLKPIDSVGSVWACCSSEPYTGVWLDWLRDRAESKKNGDTLPELPTALCGALRQSDVAIESAADELLEVLLPHSQDPDVLDTWFSSALWPLSTLGWPDPAAATKDLGGRVDFDGLLTAFNPSSVLSTAREIITLWVSRMVMLNRYLLPEGWPDKHNLTEGGKGHGPVPFRDVFIHAVVQDGNGQRMSKSAGNGVDPLDIIASHGADALRFTLCQMTTHTQDVRLPVSKDPATGRNSSPRFDLGRNFANKLWNAARFTLTMLPEAPPAHSPAGELAPIDRWMRTRLARTIAECEQALETYQFSQFANLLYTLVWNDFCDWYLEAVKPTIASSPTQQATLRVTLEAILRLLHPLMPFVTEALYEQVRRLPLPADQGVDFGPAAPLLARASWPHVTGSLIDAQAEAQVAQAQHLVGIVREARARHNVNPKRRIVMHLPPAMHERLRDFSTLISAIAGLETITTQPPGPNVPSVAMPVQDGEILLSSLADQLDAGAEKDRLAKLVAECEKAIAAFDSRLNNPGYADRAPAHLVQQTRDQRAAKAAELDAARAALERLG